MASWSWDDRRTLKPFTMNFRFDRWYSRIRAGCAPQRCARCRWLGTTRANDIAVPGKAPAAAHFATAGASRLRIRCY